MQLDEPQSLRVAVTVCGHCCLENNHAALHVHDRKRVRVAVWADTDDVVQLISASIRTDLQPKRWGTRTGAGLGMETAGGRTVTVTRSRRGQASDQASKRPPGRYRTLRSDTSLARHQNSGSFANRVTNKEHRHQPDKRPRRDNSHTHSSGMTPERVLGVSRFAQPSR
jgi:hypothetical protein